jgi:isopenicillin-N epimerase
MKRHWRLDPQICFLNHGSYGATPSAVLAAQRRLQDELERNPVAFLSPERSLEARLDAVRERLGELVGAAPDDLAFVRSATDAVNAVLRSLPLDAGDEILVTDHGYNACNNAARFAAAAHGARVQVAHVPFPLADERAIVQAIEAACTAHTRLLLVDHVTSPTALVFPVGQIIAAAHARGIRVLVDGAHAAGMLPLDIARLGPDYYTANHHKWLCAPKASGFLYVRPQLQDEVRPTVISHAASRPRPGRSRFLAEFDWTGTFDPSALLSVPAAITFLDGLCPGGLEESMAANHRLAVAGRQLLCDALQIARPSPDDMLGSMATIPLPAAGPLEGTASTGTAVTLQRRLFERHRIEVPAFTGLQAGSRLLRISLQAYNDIVEVERLAAALLEELNEERTAAAQGV